MFASRKVIANEMISSSKNAPLQRFVTRSFSSAETFEKVGVVGLGLMGHGICQVAATSYVHSSVVAFEPDQSFLDKGRSRIESSVSKMVSKGKLSKEDADAALNKINFTTDISALQDADFVIEAVIEDLDLKRDLYEKLGSLCQPSTIFASNTSSLSITEMAHMSGRPEQFVGVHFFNPVQIMKLVEVASTEFTSPDVFNKAYEWVNHIGKVPVKCHDTPGFIVNRLLIPYLAQSMRLVDRKDASVHDIDISMQLGAGHPMGPLHLADYVGLDTCYYILKGWTEQYPNEPSFVLPECLIEKVNQGDFGRKSGRGFYYWDGDKRGEPV